MTFSKRSATTGKQDELLDEMIGTGMEAIAIKVACMGLAPRKHVGKSLSDLRPTLHKLYNQFGAHICGEGGEYESLVLDCPLYQKRIIIDTSDIVMHSDDSFAPVGYLRVRAAHLEEKKDSSTHPPPPLWSEISSGASVQRGAPSPESFLPCVLIVYLSKGDLCQYLTRTTTGLDARTAR